MISKKITAFILTGVMAFGSVVSAGAVENSAVALYGDADGDGIVTVADATAIQRHCAEMNILELKYQKLADVTNDGKVTIADATCIQRYLAEEDGAGRTGTEAATEEGAKVQAERMLALINEERVNSGLKALSATTDMNKVAQLRVNELETSYSNTRPNGTKWTTAFDDCGVKIKTTALEMFARYYENSDALFAVWDSNPQKGSLYMSDKFNTIGIAVKVVESEGSNYYYWEMVLNG